MTKTPELVTEFLRGKRLAVAGVSRTGASAANPVFRKLRACGYEVLPVNPNASPEMIEVARRNALKTGVHVDFQVGLAEAMPFLNGMFDMVVSQLAIHHLPGDLKQRAFMEMSRVLKPNGRCLIVDFEPPKTVLGRFLARAVLGPVMMQTDVRDYRALLEEASFKNLETGPTRHRMLSFVRGRVARRSGEGTG